MGIACTGRGGRGADLAGRGPVLVGSPELAGGVQYWLGEDGQSSGGVQYGLGGLQYRWSYTDSGDSGTS